MEKGVRTRILVGALIVLTALPVTVYAGKGKGSAQKQIQQTRIKTQDRILNQDRIQQRDRLRDGSCITGTATTSGVKNKSGNTYGPGDGTGNDGVGPQDGTGYGAPTNR
ncbi:MAG: hypothetical protein RDU01_12340 [Thermodesulfovibrionales bacterium]|nr:hypothetical protein [Thermodesulfovibrionales bacterium]